MNKWTSYIAVAGIACMMAACSNVNSQSTVQEDAVEADNTELQEAVVVNEGEEYTPVHINSEEEFERLVAGSDAIHKWKYNGSKPCVVDFYATWCKPCAAMSPIYEALAKEYGDRINFYKADVDKLRELSIHWVITGIPTFIFCNREGYHVAVGYQEASQLQAELDKILK